MAFILTPNLIPHTDLLLLDDDAADQHRDQLAALEYNLGGIVQVAQTRIGQAHGAQREQSQDAVGPQGDISVSPRSHVGNAALEEPKHGVVSELDQRQVPAIGLEAIQREYQLLEVAVDKVEHEHTHTAGQELAGLAQTTDVEAENLQAGSLLRTTRFLPLILLLQQGLEGNIVTGTVANVNRVVGHTVISHLSLGASLLHGHQSTERSIGHETMKILQLFLSRAASKFVVIVIPNS